MGIRKRVGERREGAEIEEDTEGTASIDKEPQHSKVRVRDDKYVHLALQLTKQIQESGKHNKDGIRQPVDSNLIIPVWRQKLEHYPDSQICEFLEFGWPINISDKVEPRTEINNYEGATKYPNHIQQYLEEEINNRSVIGPIDRSTLDIQITISPLNSRPKPESTNRRVILDLSYPKGSRVNDNIDKNTYLGTDIQLQFPNVDDLVKIIKRKGKGCLLFKRDLKKAYRQIPVDPADVHHLGYKWAGEMFCDRCLPMGMRSSAYICQRTTSAVTYIMRNQGVEIINYIDDFAGAERIDKAEGAFQMLGETLEELGLKESPEKACKPATRMSFLAQ